MYDWAKLDLHVAQELKRQEVPGAAICVSDDSGVLYSRGFGYRDCDGKEKATADTIFGIASLSKSITCLAAALLEHEGKLSFDDPVAKYLPDFRIPGTPQEAVLVHHLANHTTGIPPLPTLDWSLTWHTPTEPWRAEIQERYKAESRTKVEHIDDIISFIAQGDNFRVLGPPGRYMSYLNEGYALLSSVIDKAAGEPLETYADRRIFQPLGMERTSFDLNALLPKGNVTSLFTKDKNGVIHCTNNWDNAPPYRGCGWIKSTAMDMNKYFMALSCRGVYGGKRIFPESCVERLVGRAFAETKRGTYCYGLYKRLFEDVAICEHDGGLTGVSAIGCFIKDGAFAVTVLTNLSDIDCSPLTNAALNMRLGLPLEQKHDSVHEVWSGKPENPAIYTGVYSSQEADEELRIALNANGVLVAQNDKHCEPLLFCGGSVFTSSGSGEVLPPGLVLEFHAYNGTCNKVSVGTRIWQKA